MFPVFAFCKFLVCVCVCKDDVSCYECLSLVTTERVWGIN